MIIAVSIASILAFLIAFWGAKVIPAARRAINTATDAMRVLSNTDLDDEAKESASQKAAISLLGSVISIAIRSAASVIAAGIPIYGAEALGLAPASETFDFLRRWDVIIVSSLAVTVLLLLGRRLWPIR